MVGRPSKKIPSEMGARIAELRKKAGLSQPELAEIIGIPQRTVSFYERDAQDIPAGLVPILAKALDVSVEEVLGMNETATKKRGPKSQLERQLEVVAELPRHQQQQILNVVQALITQRRTQRSPSTSTR